MELSVDRVHLVRLALDQLSAVASRKRNVRCAPPKADIGIDPPNVRFVRKADILCCGKNDAIRSPRRRGLATRAAR